MSDEETLYEKGARNLNEVYAGDVVAMPEGTMPFIDSGFAVTEETCDIGVSGVGGEQDKGFAKLVRR